MLRNKGDLRSYSSRRIPDQGWASTDITILSLDQHSYSGIPYIVSQSGCTKTVRLLQPRVDFSLIKYWLQYCQVQHRDACASTRDKAELDSISSLRFIDCETNKIVPANGMPYVALSYLWGDGSKAVAPLAVLPPDMPRTISDAITVTRAMRFRYLWVDRYCIDQSCREQVAEQVHKMDLIYNQAELTIIAAAGEGSEHGLPGVRPRKIRQPSVRIGKHFLVSSMEDPRRYIKHSNWNQRGWTYQEGLLSRRRLVFTESQVYFECGGMYCCESLNFSLSDLHVRDLSRFKASLCCGPNLGIFPRELGRTEWEVVARIQEYSNKALSDPSDILNGFSGVLRALRQSPQKVQHLKGVPILPQPPKPRNSGRGESRKIEPIFSHPYKWSPTVGFCAGLCWSAKKPLKRRHGFPSWSWTGWMGPIDWGFSAFDWKYLESGSDAQFKVQVGDTKWCDLDEYYEMCVHMGARAPISDTLLISSLVTPIHIIDGLVHQESTITASIELEVLLPTENGELAKCRFVITEENLHVALGSCLVIELAQGRGCFNDKRYVMVIAETEQGVYQRVGFLELDYAHGTVFGDMIPPLAKEWKEFRLR